jgi:transcriptional regulator with XRE-family HTH domain
MTDEPKHRPSSLRLFRKRAGLTQKQLAILLEMSDANISRIEQGRQPYKQDIIEKMADILKVHPSDLVSDPQAEPELVADLRKLLMDASEQSRRRLRTLIQAMIENERADKDGGEKP